MGRHVADKKKREVKTKPSTPGIQLRYVEAVGKWEFCVNGPYWATWSQPKYQLWWEAKEAAEERYMEHYPGSTPPVAVKCFTFNEYYAAIKEVGRK